VTFASDRAIDLEDVPQAVFRRGRAPTALLVLYVTPCCSRYSRINCRTTCEGVKSCAVHSFSNASFFTGSIRIVSRALFVSMTGAKSRYVNRIIIHRVTRAIFVATKAHGRSQSPRACPRSAVDLLASTTRGDGALKFRPGAQKILPCPGNRHTASSLCRDGD
jgi:hypothetical protein